MQRFFIKLKERPLRKPGSCGHSSAGRLRIPIDERARLSVSGLNERDLLSSKRKVRGASGPAITKHLLPFDSGSFAPITQAPVSKRTSSCTLQSFSSLMARLGVQSCRSCRCQSSHIPRPQVPCDGNHRAIHRKRPILKSPRYRFRMTDILWQISFTD